MRSKNSYSVLSDVGGTDFENGKTLASVVVIISAAGFEFVAEAIFLISFFLAKSDRCFDGLSFGFGKIYVFFIILGIIERRFDFFIARNDEKILFFVGKVFFEFLPFGFFLFHCLISFRKHTRVIFI